MFGSRSLGVVCALPREARCLRLLTQPDAAGSAIRVHARGLGYAAAASAARDLLHEGAKALLSWGYAGALDPSLQPGDIVVPACLIGPGSECIVPDAGLVAAITHCVAAGTTINKLPIAHVDSVLATVQQKRDLFQVTGAAAVDMESLAVAHIARDAGVAMASIRAIVDPAGFTLPLAALSAVDAKGRPRPLALLLSLLRHPHDCVALWRLQRLTVAADQALCALAGGMCTQGHGGNAH